MTADVGTPSDLAACDGTLTWSIVSTPDNAFFSTLQITAAGVVEFKLATTAVPGTWYRIIGRVACSDPTLSALFSVDVYVWDRCAVSPCESDENCNPCSGVCTPIINVGTE